MGWGAYFVRLIINSIVAAGILFGIALFATNRYMVTVQMSANRLANNVQTLTETVARVDADLTASVERLNNNVSRIDRELSSLQAKSGRLAAQITQIESGTAPAQPASDQTTATVSETTETETAEEAPEAAAEEATPDTAGSPVPQPSQTLPVPTSKPQQ